MATEYISKVTLPNGKTKQIKDSNANSEITTLKKQINKSVGDNSKPIYLDNGTFTASTSTVGTTEKGVYLNEGTITPISHTLSADVGQPTSANTAFAAYDTTGVGYAAPITLNVDYSSTATGATTITPVKNGTSTTAFTLNGKGTLPLTKGGTGATAKAGARTNLGITSGTASPSGGASGDIYLQYNTSSVNPIVDLIYPVGSIYMSISATNPATLFGGTWEQIKDKFLWATTSNPGGTGGSKTATLTVNQLPSHKHDRIYVTAKGYSGWGAKAGDDQYSFTSWNNPVVYGGSKENTSNVTTGETNYAGGGASHSIMPPYLEVYCWKRTK